MRRPYKVHSYLLILVLLSAGFAPVQSQWKKVDTLPSQARIFTLHTQSPEGTYLGTNQGLYLLRGQQVSQISSSAQDFALIHDVAQDVNGNILAATEKGLYSYSPINRQWQRTFFSSDEHERRCKAVLAQGYRVLGTEKGLFYQKDEHDKWHKIKGELSDQSISSLVKTPQYIFASTNNAIYRFDAKANDYQEVFTFGSALTAEEDAAAEKAIKDVKAVSGHENILVAATTKGIFISRDSGINWHHLLVSSIPLREITAILPVIENTSHGRCTQQAQECLELYIATHRGAFLFKKGSITPLYLGMETNEVNDIAISEQGELLAATNAGLYALRLEEALPDFTAGIKYDEIKAKYDNEPSIHDVHTMAIHYAEVHPDKIVQWRRQARLKAWLPSLSAGIDRAGTDRYHWDTGQSPDVLQEGKDYYDWDVSVSWDLSDLIWSTDQTSIDSRSKLMVELREDILDQVTRLFFERRRLQVELAMNEKFDGNKFDKQLRVEELTALLDAFTGGGFSRTIEASSR